MSVLCHDSFDKTHQFNYRTLSIRKRGNIWRPPGLFGILEACYPYSHNSCQEGPFFIQSHKGCGKSQKATLSEVKEVRLLLLSLGEGGVKFQKKLPFWTGGPASKKSARLSIPYTVFISK